MLATLAAKLANIENNALGQPLNENLNKQFVIAIWHIGEDKRYNICNV